MKRVSRRNLFGVGAVGLVATSLHATPKRHTDQEVRAFHQGFDFGAAAPESRDEFTSKLISDSPYPRGTIEEMQWSSGAIRGHTIVVFHLGDECKRAAHRGYDAGNNDVPVMTCPYPERTVEADMWVDQWLAARWTSVLASESGRYYNCFELGESAAVAGLSFMDCPYEHGTTKQWKWLSGWSGSSGHETYWPKPVAMPSRAIQ